MGFPHLRVESRLVLILISLRIGVARGLPLYLGTLMGLRVAEWLDSVSKSTLSLAAQPSTWPQLQEASYTHITARQEALLSRTGS